MRQYCNDINYDFIENLLNVFSTTLFHIPRTYATTWKPPFKTSTFITTKLFIIKKATQEYSFFSLFPSSLMQLSVNFHSTLLLLNLWVS